MPGAVDVHIIERLAPIDAAPGVPGFETAGSWIDPKSGIRHILETRGEVLIDKKSKDKLDKPLGKASRQISHVNLKRVIHVWINTEGRKASELAAEIERIRSKLAIPEGLRVELTFIPRLTMKRCHRTVRAAPWRRQERTEARLPNLNCSMNSIQSRHLDPEPAAQVAFLEAGGLVVWVALGESILYVCGNLLA